VSIEPGRIKTVDLGRKFKISTGGGRSLKATLLRREASSIHEFWALRHVDVDIAPGETFGVVGRNGSGKSTFLKMLARIYGPSEGSCQVGGRMSSLLELGAGFHPEFNAVENVYLAGAVYGIPKKDIERDLEEIIGFAELDKFAYQPIKTYSSGMFMRLGFSVAMHVRPDVLLLDEVLAVGDERFVQKCLSRIAQYRREGGTMLLVTHDPDTVKRLCDRAMLLEQGSLITIGSADEVMATYHDRLAQQENPTDHAEPTVHAFATFDIDTTIINAAGEKHHQFVEHEPVTIRAHLTAKTDVPDATVEFLLRDELGREIGSRSTRGRAFQSGATATLELALSNAPLRNGLFLIDVRVTDTAGGATLIDARSVDSFSIYGQDSESDGPIQLGGDWKMTSQK
jgi:ABC-type polysaccharide/polyol phosphate transport system ATPase subunit